MRRKVNGAMLALTLAAITTAPALARGNDLVIKDGFGEQVVVKHGWFGKKTVTVKDRLGDGYTTNKGLFGTKEQSVNILGNGFTRKKGLFGGSQINGSTILGDKITTKKGIFGRRTTEVDVSGASQAIKALWDKHGSQLLGKTTPAPILNTPMPNGTVNGDATVDPSTTPSTSF